MSESFETFKDSFSYGSRPDLNFKFLKGLSAEEAADFFQTLLWRIGDMLDDGDAAPVIDLLQQAQRDAYSRSLKAKYDDGPFTPLVKPVAASCLALVASSGHFVEGDDPAPFGEAGMTQAEAIAQITQFLRTAPSLSAIPFDTPPEALRVRHGGYDIRGAEADPNVNLPYVHVRALVETGVIGGRLQNAYAFVGAAAQTPLRKKVAPAWSARLRAEGAEIALLVPV